MQTVQRSGDLGLGKLGSIAIDDTKIRANATKHKGMSYARMNEQTAKLRAEVDACLRSVNNQDVDDDRALEPDEDGMSLPPELRDVQARRKKIAEAKRAKREQEQHATVATEAGRTYQPPPLERFKHGLLVASIAGFRRDSTFRGRFRPPRYSDADEACIERRPRDTASGAPPPEEPEA